MHKFIYILAANLLLNVHSGFSVEGPKTLEASSCNKCDQCRSRGTRGPTGATGPAGVTGPTGPTGSLASSRGTFYFVPVTAVSVPAATVVGGEYTNASKLPLNTLSAFTTPINMSLVATNDAVEITDPGIYLANYTVYTNFSGDDVSVNAISIATSTLANFNTTANWTYAPPTLKTASLSDGEYGIHTFANSDLLEITASNRFVFLFNGGPGIALGVVNGVGVPPQVVNLTLTKIAELP